MSRSKQQENREGNYSGDEARRGPQIVVSNEQNHSMTPGAADKFEKEALEMNADSGSQTSTEWLEP